MSIFQSLLVGVSGLQAQNNAINVISDNIANTSTVGYKQSNATFADLIANDGASNYSPAGVLAGNKQINSLQGLVSRTQSKTDVAITGDGFFIVNPHPTPTGDQYYTRAGSFNKDGDGYFRNDAGYYLQAWRLDFNGDLPAALTSPTLDSGTATAALTTVNVDNIAATPLPTHNLSMYANLKASQTIYDGTTNPYDATLTTTNSRNMAEGGLTPSYSREVALVDSLGAEHTTNIAFLKTGINTWAVEIYVNNASDIDNTASTTLTPKQIATGTLTFNGDGSLASISSGLSDPVNITWAPNTAVPPVTPDAGLITFDWGTAGAIFGTPNALVIGRADGIRQLDSDFVTDSIQQDGEPGGTFTNIAITDDGYITANYAGGTTKKLFQIPLAKFIEPDNLTSLAGTIFARSNESGTITIRGAGAEVGTLSASALEASNVEIATELANIILAQRAYQANTKTITTSDNMLDTLNRMMD